MRTLGELLSAAQEHLERGEHPQALALFDAVLKANPTVAAAVNGAGIALSQMGQVGLSIAVFNAALVLTQNDPNVWANMGASLRRAGHTQWARDAFEKALNFDARCLHALTGMAGTHVNEGDPEPGVAWGRKALAAAPDQVVNSHNLALCLLELGWWREAWPHWRNRVLPRHEARRYPGERWDGSRVDHLVIHGEQGLGDEVMFLGCVPQLRCKAANITIECNKRLVPLVARSFPGVAVIGEQSEYVAPTDGVSAWVPMGDLPSLCVDQAPPRVSGYFAWPAGERTNDVLLAFRGGTMETHDYLRNPPIETWRPVLDAIRARGWRPVSVQYGPQGAELAERMGIEHDAEAAGDLTIQADRIALSRGLVSVQQTALHLGGAAGAKVWGVISNKPAWRYGLAGEMPWYRTVELFRQARDERDWSGVMKRTAAAIAAYEMAEAA